MPWQRLQFEIQPAAPFAFRLALQYLRRSPSSIVECITEDSYARALEINGKDVLLVVRGGLEESGPLAVELAGATLGPPERAAGEQIVRRLFQTDQDLSELYERAGSFDAPFARLVHRFRGLRPIQIPDLFETIAWAIIGQQINTRFAAKCKRALVERYGGRLELDGQEWLIFPGPERVARLSESDLAAIQFSRQKIRYVLGLAREIADGRLDLEGLRSMPADDAQARLQEIVGIGRWTAEYVLMRGLGHRDAIPAADGGLRQIIGRAYGFGRLASEAEVRELAEGWAGWRSYAAFYWWAALQEAITV